MKQVKVQRRRGFTRLSAKHQVTIPIAAVAALGLTPGDELKVDVDRAGRIVLSPALDPEARRRAILTAAGKLTGVWKLGELERSRDEWR